MPRVLKVSPQRQVTLPKDVWEAIGKPSYVEAEVVKGDLVIRSSEYKTLEEAEHAWGKHGITRAVLVEALKIVEGREKEGGET